jgi:hypothetical protein
MLRYFFELKVKKKLAALCMGDLLGIFSSMLKSSKKNPDIASGIMPTG